MLMALLSSPASIATPCENLFSLALPDTTITVAQTVAAGALTLPTPLPTAGPRGGLTFVSAKGLPEFCRVSAVIKPSKDSEIKFEVWMPASNWNGKFAGLGNGAMGGSISYGSMAAALSRGYFTLEGSIRGGPSLGRNRKNNKADVSSKNSAVTVFQPE
jgi:feruloyl esterase